MVALLIELGPAVALAAGETPGCGGSGTRLVLVSLSLAAAEACWRLGIGSQVFCDSSIGKVGVSGEASAALGGRWLNMGSMVYTIFRDRKLPGNYSSDRRYRQ